MSMDLHAVQLDENHWGIQKGPRLFLCVAWPIEKWVTDRHSATRWGSASEVARVLQHIESGCYLHLGDQHFNPDLLDARIRNTVLWLRGKGFNAGASQGGVPDTEDRPYVCIAVTPEEMIDAADNLYQDLLERGLALGKGGGEMFATYCPRFRTATIDLYDVVIPEPFNGKAEGT